MDPAPHHSLDSPDSPLDIGSIQGRTLNALVRNECASPTIRKCHNQTRLSGLPRVSRSLSCLEERALDRIYLVSYCLPQERYPKA